MDEGVYTYLHVRCRSICKSFGSALQSYLRFLLCTWFGLGGWVNEVGGQKGRAGDESAHFTFGQGI